jgi:sulfite exporter TauE/SafE
MCGGIAGALTVCLPSKIRQSPFRLITYLIAYNLGRLSSYTIAGLLAGLIGSQITHHLLPETVHEFSAWISGIFMITLGLYLGQWWQTLAFLERLGHHVWCRVEPLGRHLLPVKTLLQAYGMGLVWGWFPCGLIYSMLVLTLTSKSVWQGGLLMLSFGIGTLPMILSISTTAHWLTIYIRKLVVQRVIAFLIILTWFGYLFWGNSF